MKIEFKDQAEVQSYVDKHGTDGLEATCGGKPVVFEVEAPAPISIKAQKPTPVIETARQMYNPTAGFDAFRANKKWEGHIYKAVYGSDFNADDTVLADGASTVVDELLPIRVIPFQSELLKAVTKIPVTQNSFRVLQMSINENAITKLSTNGLSG